MTLRDQFTDAQRTILVADFKAVLAGSAVPDHLREGLVRYLEAGILPGGFLQAVLCNNLAETVLRQGYGGIQALPALIDVLIWAMPAEAWGSRDAVLAWTTTPNRLEV